MAKATSKALKNQMMYQVFVRNYSPEGTFKKVEERLDEIKALGTDIIWLMPIHPIGTVKRKGSLGSPYAISDYRAVNLEFGTMEDFKSLVKEIHARGMKCIIDVVYNHTSPDSLLSKEHPEWFYHKEDGSFGNRVGDWTDIIDLDYGNRDLWDYQIETLKMWAEIVDGFRCDVAPLIPLEFWLKARAEVETVRPGCIWLSESVEPGFITYMRGRGITALPTARSIRRSISATTTMCMRSSALTSRVRARSRRMRGDRAAGIHLSREFREASFSGESRPDAGGVPHSRRKCSGELDGVQLLPEGLDAGLCGSGIRRGAYAESVR